ncbi:hypothetical protein [Salipaludibacillus aurantiacus]|uniref:Uncharacterized protein n=1 Tax=Salipaludibacillus aurantiacus TaxID=1601833 RepID=A0A1H9WA65_9BACI|nr:hypothetical protein [Salipaludibacillus aurantiacus]SES30715.1 hypothetical protein SAMN05518684_11575 [Salipaludibacillus aurantiacus]
MLDTVQTTFTICVQRNVNGTYTLAGLVNEESLSDAAVLELQIKDEAGFFKKVRETEMDEFRYFEMTQIQLESGDLDHLYLKLKELDILEKVEFTDK